MDRIYGLISAMDKIYGQIMHIDLRRKCNRLTTADRKTNLRSNMHNNYNLKKNDIGVIISQIPSEDV